VSARSWVVRVGQAGAHRYVGRDGKDSARNLAEAHVFANRAEACAEANLWTNGRVEPRELTAHKRRILTALGAGQPLDLRLAWVQLMELHSAGLIRLENQTNGQLLIRGLTDAGRALLEEANIVEGRVGG
jgi:hypothetical protein